MYRVLTSGPRVAIQTLYKEPVAFAAGPLDKENRPMPRTIQRALGPLAGLGLVAALAAPVAAQNEAFVRVVHASPDAPNVDVWVDGETVLTDVAFTAVSDYLALPAGTHNVQVTATGSTDPVIDADLTLDSGVSYTVAATGLLADITATVLTDDRTPANDQSKLRVFHAS